MKVKKKETQSETAKLTEQFKKANSLWRSFFKGILMGVGSAIGAVIIAGLVIVILTKTISYLDEIPIIKNIIEGSNIESILEKSQ